MENSAFRQLFVSCSVMKKNFSKIMKSTNPSSLKQFLRRRLLNKNNFEILYYIVVMKLQLEWGKNSIITYTLTQRLWILEWPEYYDIYRQVVKRDALRSLQKSFYGILCKYVRHQLWVLYYNTRGLCMRQMHRDWVWTVKLLHSIRYLQTAKSSGNVVGESNVIPR